MKSKLWKTKNKKSGDFNFSAGINPLIDEILNSRCETEEDIKDFLEADEILHDPFLLPDMEKAARRVNEAVEKGETICIYGDYDCDGVCATAILTDYLQNIGARVFYYIPNREKEGYGMNIPAVDFIKEQGADLIITVDNGITAMEEIEHALSLGIETVVTDHHTPRDILPNAVANVNPHLKNSEYPFKNICGAVVAFKLACALEGDDGFCLMEQYGDLLAIATTGDVMELKNENRYIVKFGLQMIKEGRRSGITKLLNKAGIEDIQKICSDTIGFTICPRINAAGRLDSADYPVMLFLSEDESEQDELAQYLDNLNYKRKEEENRIIKDIRDDYLKKPDLFKDKILVLKGFNWNPGVVGIVSSRLTERFQRPVLVLSSDGTNAKGSGRSVEGFSLIEAITACSSPLEHFGGHPMAAGFSLKDEDVDEFRRLLNEYAEKNPIPNVYLDIDMFAEPEILNVENIESLKILEPFGTGNPPVVLGMKNALIIKEYPLSGGKHTKYRVRKSGREYNLICFNLSFDYREAFCGDYIDIAFTPSVNEWQGNKDVDMIMVSMKMSGSDYEEITRDIKIYEEFKEGKEIDKSNCPKRDETAVLYRLLRIKRLNLNFKDWEYERYREKINLSYIKFLLSFDILKELGTIKEDEKGMSEVIINAPKCDFNSSSTVRRFA